MNTKGKLDLNNVSSLSIRLKLKYHFSGSAKHAVVVQSWQWWCKAGSGGAKLAVVVQSWQWWYKAGSGGAKLAVVVQSWQW